MKKMYETKRDAFIAGYASVNKNEAGPYVLKGSIGTKKAFSDWYHSKKHAYLSGVTLAKCIVADLRRIELASAKDAVEAVDAAKSFAASAKAAYLAAKRAANYVAHISSLSARDAAKIAAAAKLEWKESDRAATSARKAAYKI